MCVPSLSLCHFSVTERGSTDPRGKAGVFVTSVLGESEWSAHQRNVWGRPASMEDCR